VQPAWRDFRKWPYCTSVGHALGPVEEEKRTGLPLARFISEILRATNSAIALGDRNSKLRRTQRLWDLHLRSDGASSLFVIARHDLTEFFVARETV